MKNDSTKKGEVKGLAILSDTKTMTLPNYNLCLTLFLTVLFESKELLLYFSLAAKALCMTFTAQNE